MAMKTIAIAASGFLAALGAAGATQAKCSAQPVFINSSNVEAEGSMTVNAGSGCYFNVNGIPGAISEVKITQLPKNGKAGVENLKAYYVAKAGYQGSDEFAYAFIGTDQYGGPMKVVIKRKITVVP